METRRPEAERSTGGEGNLDEQSVWNALRQVFDPEIPVSIVDLGLVYGVSAEPMEGGGHKVTVRMTLTAPACGIAPILVEDVRRSVLAVPEVKQAEVEVVFDPPWDPSRLSEEAKLKLGFV